MSFHMPARTNSVLVSEDRYASDLIARVADSALEPRQIVERTSAIRCICKAFGTTPEHTSIRRLKNDLATLSPAQCGVSRRTYENYQSQVRQALFEHLPDILNTRAIPLSDAWQQLLDKVDDPHVIKAVGRIGRWASYHGIDPEGIKQGVADLFGADLKNCMLCPSARNSYASMCRAWNGAAKRYPDFWPQEHLSPGDKRNNYVLPMSQIDDKFKVDLDEMLASFGSPLTLPDGFTAPYEESTLAEMRRIFARMYSVAVSNGRSITSIEDLVGVPSATSIVQHYLTRFPKENTKSANKYAHFLFVAAKHWVKSKEETLRTLQRFRTNTKPKNVGMTPHNRKMLQQFEDEELVARLLRQGEEALEKFKRIKKPTLADALRLQTALAIDILTSAPVRPHNLASINLKKHVIRHSLKASAKYHLVFTADEVKNDKDLEYKMPARVQKLFEFYVAHALPLISVEDNPHLFPGQGFRAKVPKLLSEQIAKRALAVLGVRVTGHRFRHLVGFIYLKDNPGGHEAVRLFLGHKNIETTIRHYAGMEQAAGIALVQQHFEQKYREFESRQKQKRSKWQAAKPTVWEH